jgi:AcrR family transcriptional regulator
MAAKARSDADRTYTISLANRKPRGSGHERLEEILAAAKALFVEHGFENVSTQRIAERVGISKTALFSYYKTKDEILSHLIRDALAELDRALTQIDRSAPDTVTWLRRFITGYIAFGLKYPDEYRLAFMIIKPDKKLDDAQQPPPVGAAAVVGLAIFRRVEERVRAAIAEGVIRRDLGSATVVAQVLWSSVHGLVALLIARPRPHFPWARRDRLIKTMVSLLLDGLLVNCEPSKTKAIQNQGASCIA